jgi:hypothetical protein
MISIVERLILRSLRSALILLSALVMLSALPARADDLLMLTTGKVAVSKDSPGTDRDRGTFRFSKDPVLLALEDPTCPGTSSVQLATYPQATNRVEAQPVVDLPCENWTARGSGYVYDDPTGAHGGVRRISYKPGKLVLKMSGAGFTPVVGPVAYMEIWFVVGPNRYHGRFHSFRQNDSAGIKTRRPSAAAAAGEAAFWDVLHNNDNSTARQEAGLAALQQAASGSRKDGRAPFLQAMLQLYRFGQATTDFGTVSPFAEQELAASHAAFQDSLPLLWDGTAGDSRVPGFAAGTKFTQGLVTGDTALQAEGLQDLADAVAVNQFFNIFDYIPIIQALPPSDPRFVLAFNAVIDYLNAPDTLNCITTQPELCGNEGLAPHNAEGAVLLFGDVYAKAGDLSAAQVWYSLAKALGELNPEPWPFQAVADERVATAAARVALYQDLDPGNDPPIIGAGAEACAFCHYK